jgi:hypothetical protein
VNSIAATETAPAGRLEPSSEPDCEAGEGPQPDNIPRPYRSNGSYLRRRDAVEGVQQVARLPGLRAGSTQSSLPSLPNSPNCAGSRVGSARPR